MGHTIDPLNYNRIMDDDRWVDEQYRLALPYLNIISSNKPFGLYTEDEVNEKVAVVEVRASKTISDFQTQLDEINKQLKENYNYGSG